MGAEAILAPGTSGMKTMIPPSTGWPLKVTVPLTDGWPEQPESTSRAAARARTAGARRAAQRVMRRDLRKKGSGPAGAGPRAGVPGLVVADGVPVGGVAQVLHGEVRLVDR